MTKMPVADLLTHPIRARILLHLMGRELTTGQIASLLSDIPRASLYRQIRRLLDGQMITVVREVPVRGTLEKVYTVRREAGRIPDSEAEAASPAEHLQHFTAFVDTMTAFYQTYLEGTSVAPQEQVIMVATPIYTDKEGYERFKRELRQLIASHQSPSSPEDAPPKERRLLWVASIPDTKPADSP